MVDENIEAYHTDQHEKSLFRAVILRLNAQSPAFKRTHLPPRYLEDDALATAHVVAQVKTLLKHICQKERNFLLTRAMLNGNTHC
ncbi:hypothetical protein PCANC_24961 [Puccinia coronata f. sp. avenae]|uniref:Uncharacterized protein n=2 Tax=Puccinia coronata f. sp. avenae TaxID=200324 RepID=A0A2N5S328_9BASI|nr:hypothetical protein PCANC_24961 [Puccinia coronata f. sp. avenae]